MSDVQELEVSITDAIEQISKRRTTPKRCGIGRLLTQMSGVCPDTYNRLLTLYKPVANDFFSEKSQPKEKVVISNIEKDLAMIEKNLSFDIDDFDDFGELLPDVFNKLIEDASARIEGKKKKVVPTITQEDPTIPRIRNRQGYNFNGEVYGKGPLVLAVIRHHVENNPTIDYKNLNDLFPDDLLKSYGIFKRLDVAQEASKKRKRYFLKTDQLITISDCLVAVCNQFTSANIGAFIEKAMSVGYVITEEDL